MSHPSRWTYVFAGLSVALAACCVVQWRREAALRAELAEVGGQVAVSEKKAFDAAKLADTYAVEIRTLETRVTELKKAEAGLKSDTLKATAALRKAEAGLLQAKADLGAAKEAITKQNDSIRKQNTVIAEQNDGIRRLNEAFKKVVDDRNEVVRLLNERTDMLNKLNAEKAGK
jgi:chromosome segregation ATPase